MNLKVDIRVAKGRFRLDAAFECAASALGVFGPSGCGKTTLLRALAGLVRPDEGRIELDGDVLFDADRGRCAPPHRRRIGMVFQEPRLFPHWGVERNLRAGERKGSCAGGRRFSFDDVVDLLSVGPLLDRPVGRLSGGEKQRIALGRALLSHPRLLLLDEPVSGLDSPLKARILPFLDAVRADFGIPIVLVSHDLGEILPLTDRLLLLREGCVAGHGTLSDLATDADALNALSGVALANVIRGCVSDHDVAGGVTRLVAEGAGEGVITADLAESASIGSPMVVGVCANQIALARNRVEGISMRNQFPARVLRVVRTPERSLCWVDAPVGRLFVEITPATEHALVLREGAAVWVLFKARALRRLVGAEA